MEIGAGGTLEQRPNSEIHVTGDFMNNGTFVPNGGTVIFDGTSPQTIGGTSGTTFDPLRLDNSAGVAVDAPVSVTASLVITPATRSSRAWTR